MGGVKMKKSINMIFGIISVLSIALIVLMFSLAPNTIINFFGFNYEDSIVAKVPYYYHFSSVKAQSGYKAQYVIDDNKYWYASWSNDSSQDFILGWNSDSGFPVYSNSGNKNNIIKKIEIDLEKEHYAYINMEFDFTASHDLSFSIRPLDGVHGTTRVYLVASENKGLNWFIDEVYDKDKLSYNSSAEFKTKFTQFIGKSIRYGLVVVSDSNQFRLVLEQFYAQKSSN